MSQLPLPICYSEYNNQIISKARPRAALFVFLGSPLSMSEETLLNELLHAVKLDGKHRGELAELAFMRKAASLGFAVAKPWGDSDRYDVVVRFESTFWRVQIKSVLGKSPSRGYYRVQTAHSRQHTYTAKDIDFLVAYIFAEDIWYVLPAHVVENKKSLCLTAGSKRSSSKRSSI